MLRTMPNPLLRRAQLAIDESSAVREQRRSVIADFDEALATLRLSILKSETQRYEFMAARQKKE
jgi:hypothetical protein